MRFGEMFAGQFGTGYTTSSDYWTLTPAPPGYVYYITAGADSYGFSATENGGSRPAIYLKSSVYITGGTGLPNNPFTIAM